MRNPDCRKCKSYDGCLLKGGVMSAMSRDILDKGVECVRYLEVTFDKPSVDCTRSDCDYYKLCSRDKGSDCKDYERFIRDVEIVNKWSRR
ncbi:hypothetical protein FACS1894199_07960 [Bacteroidia bacterium]|nr:hypothetical protein FACS1894199_07960 [Bacteroidia bacterium]